MKWWNFLVILNSVTSLKLYYIFPKDNNYFCLKEYLSFEISSSDIAKTKNYKFQIWKCFCQSFKIAKGKLHQIVYLKWNLWFNLGVSNYGLFISCSLFLKKCILVTAKCEWFNNGIFMLTISLDISIYRFTKCIIYQYLIHYYIDSIVYWKTKKYLISR